MAGVLAQAGKRVAKCVLPVNLHNGRNHFRYRFGKTDSLGQIYDIRNHEGRHLKVNRSDPYFLAQVSIWWLFEIMLNRINTVKWAKGSLNMNCPNWALTIH